MQDLHAIGGGGGGGGGAGAGRFFSGGGGDRRLRPHNHQALKCPRCDSLNTKFCYYNNYNLSQPRHFCKACRRYWTKGGVLRSVPVGGGCRKTKRSKPKSSSADSPRERKSKAQSSSSTDSSSLTASTPTSATGAVAEVGSALSATTTSNSATMYNFSDAMFFNVNPPANPNFDNHQPLMNHSSSESQIFMEIGSFTNLMTSSGNATSMMGFSMGDIPTTSYDRLHQVSGAENQVISDMVGPTDVDEFKMQVMTGGISSDGLASALDWGNGSGGGEDQGLFDLSAAVDPAYWSEPQWTDNDHSLNYLP